MLNVIEFQSQGQHIDSFLRLPGRLYDKKTLTQNETEERRILNGTHALSGSFYVHKFLLYDSGEAVGRFIITLYDNDDAAYLGFFECVDSPEAARVLFDFAKDFSRQHGKKQLIGPYDASFWIKYRLKINNFGVPYTGEPYNKDYYYKMFLDNGFEVLKHYVSNIFPKMPPKKPLVNSFADRYEQFVNNGYVFKSPSSRDIDKMMSESYEMLVSLYCDFPGYKPITREQYMSMFSHMKLITDRDMLKMVYYKNEPVGFIITTPDYSNRLYKARLCLRDYAEILLKRHRSSKYVWMYMGVKPGHRGLGKALCSCAFTEQCRKKASFICALIKDGNANINYFSEISEGCDEYVLLKCEL